jgi:hypothetical protein
VKRKTIEDYRRENALLRREVRALMRDHEELRFIVGKCRGTLLNVPLGTPGKDAFAERAASVARQLNLLTAGAMRRDGCSWDEYYKAIECEGLADYSRDFPLPRSVLPKARKNAATK